MDDTDTAAVAAIAALDVEAPEIATIAARTIKNTIIGNPTNKRIYLGHGALPRLIACASHAHEFPVLTEHTVAALGSLTAFLSPSDTAQVTTALLRCLFSSNRRPVYAAARALKLLVCSPSAGQSSLSSFIVEPNVASRFVALLGASDEGVAEVCAVLIARTSEAAHHVQIFNDAGAVPALCCLLNRTLHERCVEACIDALAALARHSVDVSHALTSRHAVIPRLMPFTRTPLHTLRLAACRLLTIFHLASCLPIGLDANVTMAVVNLLTWNSHDALDVTAQTLAELVTDSPNLQRVATESGAIVKLADILLLEDESYCRSKASHKIAPHLMREENMANSSDNMIDNEINDNLMNLRASALNAIAALTNDFDAARDAVIGKNLLNAIVEALALDNFKIVDASVRCIQSLSRSVKILRRDMFDKSIGKRVLALLRSERLDIQRSASAALCNLVPDFSPVRGVIVENGGIDVVIGLLESRDLEVRKNCLWALKNLLYKADLKMKNSVLSKLGSDSLELLFADKDPKIRSLAMTVMRNFACSPSAGEQNEQLDALFSATGKKLTAMLSDALRVDSTNIEMAVQALYVVCNIASGTEQHKACLLESEIPQLILQWTSHADEQARIAAVWCTINLSWKEPVTSSHRQTRIVQRAIRAAGRRSSSSIGRLDILRRQHLPLPASPTGRRILERYGGAGGGRIGSGSSDGNDDAWFEEDSLMEEADVDGNQSESNSDESGAQTQEDGNPGERGQNEDESELSPLGSEANGSGVEEIGGNNNSGSNNSSPKNCGYEWRIERLRQLGFEGRLRSLINDPHIEVQGRARRALEHFDCTDITPLDYDPSALLASDSPLLTRHSQRASPAILRGTYAGNLYISSA